MEAMKGRRRHLGDMDAMDLRVTLKAMTKSCQQGDEVALARQMSGGAWSQQDFYDLGYTDQQSCQLCGMPGPLPDWHTAWQCTHPDVVAARQQAKGGSCLGCIRPELLPPALLAGVAPAQTACMDGPYWHAEDPDDPRWEVLQAAAPEPKHRYSRAWVRAECQHAGPAATTLDRFVERYRGGLDISTVDVEALARRLAPAGARERGEAERDLPVVRDGDDGRGQHPRRRRRGHSAEGSTKGSTPS